jgi:ATP-dependent DNA helicase RecQ
LSAIRTDDTRVKTAVSWLEEAVLLKREENRVRFSRPAFASGRSKRQMGSSPKRTWTRLSLKLKAVVRSLINAPA